MHFLKRFMPVFSQSERCIYNSYIVFYIVYDRWVYLKYKTN